jgi:hypothetical protein
MELDGVNSRLRLSHFFSAEYAHCDAIRKVLIYLGFWRRRSAHAVEVLCIDGFTRQA